uniref:Tumor protein D52 n=1 Tax=Gasterosteus aculeatus aculeatus TaxID=481459 RepID=A0AAQ4PRD3_GASAC
MQLCLVDGVTPDPRARLCLHCCVLTSYRIPPRTAIARERERAPKRERERERERAGRSAAANKNNLQTLDIQTSRINAQSYNGGCRERFPAASGLDPRGGRRCCDVRGTLPRTTRHDAGGAAGASRKVEDEILTLSQVLAAKEKQLADIKRKLGITPLNELKQNFTKTWQEVTTSTAYRRTSETLSQASLKATAAFSNVGSAITRKLEDVRNAQTFKSFEEKVETLKTKMSPTPSTGDPGQEDSDDPTGDTLIPQPDGSATQETPTN